MNKYKIKLKLLSETIFGSGYSTPASVDLEIVSDEYGIPFLKAKTFKGNLREHMENTNKLLGNKYSSTIKNLLGDKGKGLEAHKNLKFSDCRLKKPIREILENNVRNKKITKEEIKESLTDIRYFTSIDEFGKAKDSSLRRMRVVKKGLEFEIDLSKESKLTEEELGILSISLRSLRHIGTMRTRGKGEVECRLFIEEKGELIDKTDFYIDKFFRRGETIE